MQRTALCAAADAERADAGLDLASASSARRLPPKLGPVLRDIVIERFKALSEKTGKGYQTLLNEALRAHLGVDDAPLTATALRRILREELSQHG